MLHHLSELRPAPSVQMQDVPRESVDEHLGLGGVHAHGPIDELDERLARTYPLLLSSRSRGTDAHTFVEHARFVYDIQKDSDQTDSEPEPEQDTSDGESSRRSARGRSSRRIRSGKKRMSIVTSKYFDVPRLPPEFEREIEDEQDGCGHGGRGSAYGNGTGSGKKRRFFQSVAEWDPVQKVVLERARAGVGPTGRTFENFRMPVSEARDQEPYSEDGDGMDVDPDGDEDEE